MLAVIDTNIFVPAIAGHEDEARFYNAAINKCWKFAFSETLMDEYRRVINEYGYQSLVIIHEINKLYAMNKYRSCDAKLDLVADDLAPPDDRHLVVVCKVIGATLLITKDGGLHERKERILHETGANVVDLLEAERILGEYRRP